MGPFILVYQRNGREPECGIHATMGAMTSVNTDSTASSGASGAVQPVTYADQFSDVWLWNEWPDRQGRADTGVDIITADGSVQGKG